ncbi:MAG: sugar ABC transporter ATP-binding protein [Candidatus Humimicrobiaceae bacterium]
MGNDEKFALYMDNVGKKFPGTVAVENMTFDVKPGEVHALVGENGAGKSTLMKMLSGAFDDYTGIIFINGKEVRLSSPIIAKQNGIAMIYQELSLAYALSIAENVLAGRLPVKGIVLDKKEIDAQTTALLSRVGIEYLDPQTEVNQLSQHEMQLVEIAKVLGRDPKIMVMDEPTSALTREEVERLFDIIQTLKASGLSIVYISHHLSEIFKVADRVTVMRDGKKVGTYDIKEVTMENLAELMVGHSVEELYTSINTKFGDEIFRVENLWRFGFFHGISFTVKRGEIVGICGLSGAGRSEIARSICGLDPLDEGKIFLKGRQIKIKSMGSAVKMGIAYLTENRKSEGLALRLSMALNLVSVILPELSKFFIYSTSKAKPKIKKQINYLKINPSNPSLEVSNLSGGNQQKVLLGKWLASEPIVLILDEPTRGVDVGAKKIIHDSIIELSKVGLAIILISSDLPELVGLSNRMLVIREGKLIGELPKEACTEESALLAANGECGRLI